VRFPRALLTDAGITPEALAPRLAREIAGLMARDHLLVRRRGDGASREFDARPSIVALELGSDAGSSVLDCHLRFTPRAAVRPEELLMELMPEADPRGADVERTALWAEPGGRRMDPLELLTLRDDGVARLHRITA
jgi:hypothetical protein